MGITENIEADKERMETVHKNLSAPPENQSRAQLTDE